MSNLNELNRTRWAVRLAHITGLTLLFLAALLWGLQGVTPARADPGTLYVDGSTGSDDSDCSNSADPCATIGYALAQAANGDEILVAEGTYMETLNIVISVTLKGRHTVGGTAWLPGGETVIDADGAEDAAVWIYPGTNVTVEGFTVQGANHTSDAGGGFLIDGSTVLISDTVIQDNTTAHGGGGVDVQGGTLTLVNSSLLNNTAGGGSGGGLNAHSWGLITLDNVTVQGNVAQGWGGGLHVPRVSITNSRIVSNTAVGRGGGVAADAATIYESEISGNTVTGEEPSGGGIDVGASGAGRLVVCNSMVSDNQAVGTVGSLGGGIQAGGAEATIVNTVVSNNASDIRAVDVYGAVITVTNSLFISNTGGGLGGRYVTGTIVNATFADNTGIGLFIGGEVTVTNSIMWGNEEHNYFCTGGCTLTYCDVEDEEIAGTGNIYADPLFVDPINGDYHLGVGSPCIDKGTSVGAPTHDIERTPRDARPDIGAYEWTGFRVFLPLTVRSFGS
jgi:hypothetical protein